MHATQKISRLTRATLLFPIALVLFEFAVYIANDMIQPAMLMVTQEFQVSNEWVAIAMTAFTLGGASMSLIVGPLSDRVGRRPVMLIGVIYFILVCMATYLATDIVQFMLLRVLQGMGLCLIGAVGYAVIQEAFEENAAVKTIALMANVSLIAPMIGPLAGATLIEFAPWRTGFLLISLLSALALVGLWRSMPETIDRHAKSAPISKVLHDYAKLLTNSHFMLSALCLPILCTPLVAWIAISPVLLVDDMKLSMWEYGLWQLPVFGSLIVGNLCVARWADRWPLGRTVLMGVWPISVGALCAALGLLDTIDTPLYIATGISLFSFALGLSFSVLYRFTLMCTDLPKGAVSAAMAAIALGVQAAGIEVTRIIYVHWGVAGFTWISIAYGLAFIVLSRPRIHREMLARA